MTTERPLTVAVLYPGEMGAALATLLLSRGVTVVTTLAGRGPATARRCGADGIRVLDSLGEVVRTSEVVISVVSPGAAEELAAEYCRLAHLAPANALYVDANSIGPELAVAIGARLTDCGSDFVDAAVNGLARTVATGGTMFLSGRRAGEVERLFGASMRVSVVGDEAGRASAMKMLLSGLSKGLCALYLEAALLARGQGLLTEMNDAYARIYPGVMAVVERMLPTYAQHAGRRADEMKELEQTARSAGLDAWVFEAIRRVHEELAAVDFAAAGSVGAMNVASFVERLAAEGFAAAGDGAVLSVGAPSDGVK